VLRSIALATLALAAAGGSAFGSTAQGPHLRVMDSTPLTVSGAGFRNHEQVQVTYHADQTWTRRVTATAAGTFTARFAGVTFQTCKTHRLSAVGSMGSKAFFKMPPVSCPPPPDEP
jgi:hypothetical protein